MRTLDGRCPLQVGRSLCLLALSLVLAALGTSERCAAEEPVNSKPVTARQQVPNPSAPVPASRGPDSRAEPNPEPATTKLVSGIVRDQDGKPVAGVMITGTEWWREVFFGKSGVLDDIVRHDWLYTESGPDGHYRFEGESMKRTTPPINEFGLFAYHAQGYARRSADELAKSGDFTLEPWGRVYGIVMVLGKPLANVPLRLTLDATDQHSMSCDIFEFDSRTDERGRYSVEHVPAGVVHVSTGTRFGKDTGPYGIVSSARKLIKAGETLKLNVGGAGRPVVGHFRVPDGKGVRLVQGCLALKTSTNPEPAHAPGHHGHMTEASRKQDFLRYLEAYRSPEGLARRLAQRFYDLQIHWDGTFRTMEVEAGTYSLLIWFGADSQHPVVVREVVVPPMAERRTSEPLDLGAINIAPPAPQ